MIKKTLLALSIAALAFTGCHHSQDAKPSHKASADHENIGIMEQIMVLLTGKSFQEHAEKVYTNLL